MSDACFTARATTKAHVTAAIGDINLAVVNGQYSHDAIAQFIVAVKRVLKSTYNPAEPGCGMEMLLRSSTDTANPSKISAIKSTDVATIATIIRDSSADAKAAKAASGIDEPDEPTIVTRADAMDAADRANQMTQAVIGAKEGTAAAITAKVGERVTDAVLRTADGMDYKSIDEFELYELVTAAMQAADRPRVREIRQQLLAVLSIRFNFRQRFSDNVAVLRARIARIAAYGITVHEDMIATTILAEADEAAREDWGREIETAMGKIRLSYGYDYPHDAASVAIILKELAAADAVRDLMAAPAPTTNNNLGQANAAGDAMSHVRRLIFDDDSTVGTAAAAGYESDSSAESDRKSRASRSSNTDKAKQRGRSKSKARAEQTAATNPCKYCKRNGRRNRHPNVPPEQCFWNKKWKGFRPRYVCRAINLPYQEREAFVAEFGGYVSDDGETSDDE